MEKIKLRKKIYENVVTNENKKKWVNSFLLYSFNHSISINN